MDEQTPMAQPLAGDASVRRYLRRRGAGSHSVVECHYPDGEHNTLERDISVRGWFAAHGLGVPAIVAIDRASRVVTIEDLGDVDAAAGLAAAKPSDWDRLVARLLAPLVDLAQIPLAALPPFNPPLDRRLLRFELAGFELWYLRNRRGSEPPALVSEWLDALADTVGEHPRRVCHRDYHLNNLLLDAQGRVRIIDEQDVRPGPASYDVVSLLWDRGALSLLTDEQRRSALDAWARRTGAAPGWPQRCVAVRCQRGLKVLGTFARLVTAGHPRYERWIEPLERSLEAPLAALGAPPWLVALLLD